MWIYKGKNDMELWVCTESAMNWVWASPANFVSISIAWPCWRPDLQRARTLTGSARASLRMASREVQRC